MLQASDIQGLVLRGYKELPHARYVLLSFQAPFERARAWLRSRQLTSGEDTAPASAVNLALTYAGLEAIMGDRIRPDAWARELREGMAGSDQRQRLLGDVGLQAPRHWEWGAPGRGPAIHAVLLVFAQSEAELGRLEQEQLAGDGSAHGLLVIRRLGTRTLNDIEGDTRGALFREHFGFRDGVAQPLLAGDRLRESDPGPHVSKLDRLANTIPAGEILFGHDDAYHRPPDGAGDAELARNGSFMVLRQLEQHVFELWREMIERARALHVEPILLASKLVGRWPSGAPLVVAPEEDTAGLERFDAFGYRERDPSGARCPFGSHIRRTNPRDDLVEDADESLRLTKLHRMIRRGRPYGEPIHVPLEPEIFLPKLATLEAAERRLGNPVKRGLHFVCFNTNFSRQFEFVQSTWTDNPRFAEGRDAPDPLIGPGGDFELPSAPAVRRVPGLPRFVTTRGGAYFFMPGLEGLQRIAS